MSESLFFSLGKTDSSASRHDESHSSMGVRHANTSTRTFGSQSLQSNEVSFIARSRSS